MRAALLTLAVFAPALAMAQDQGAGQVNAAETTDAPGALLRALDKVSGQTVDLTLKDGESGTVGAATNAPLTVTLTECRYPKDNPAADAFANLDVIDAGGTALFGGWMVASSPALSALDHPRYDVWVLSCILPDAPAPAEESAETSSGG
ncbi:DUF2155 domain-containing protein [Frigidibacter sp. RF13]|uniref:DUF2155 domain-containing protein n=1 Tax=Frigidibacter sp. RF13 TaxID=2997340 RepID=UPI00226F9461|nr:DUF2155 domain-containing protein [Frigidibacter sp. RF13]MCY1125683.1 DUF2155 domain-containing protein [Frigidibacter sp. RF13]